MENLEAYLQQVKIELNAQAVILMRYENRNKKLFCHVEDGSEIWQRRINSILHHSSRAIIEKRDGSNKIYGSMILPIWVQDRVWGTMEVLHDQRDVVFSENEVEIALGYKHKVIEILNNDY